jgi:hypothetical protein
MAMICYSLKKVMFDPTKQIILGNLFDIKCSNYIQETTKTGI